MSNFIIDNLKPHFSDVKEKKGEITFSLKFENRITSFLEHESVKIKLKSLGIKEEVKIVKRVPGVTIFHIKTS